MTNLVTDALFVGFIAGVTATAIMTIGEIPAWRKWGLLGVFEWHENQLLATRFFRISQRKVNFKYIFALHFLNGSLAGIAFPFILSVLNISISLYQITRCYYQSSTGFYCGSSHLYQYIDP